VVYPTAPSGRPRSLIKQAFEQTAKDLRNFENSDLIPQ
jgi:hypothetical protein